MTRPSPSPAEWKPTPEILARLATTAEKMRALDQAEVLEGYFDGRKNEPPPGANRSDSYAHGWFCGMHDGHHREWHPIGFKIVAAWKEAHGEATRAALERLSAEQARASR